MEERDSRFIQPYGVGRVRQIGVPRAITPLCTRDTTALFAKHRACLETRGIRAERYPAHAELQHYAWVLAPPRRAWCPPPPRHRRPSKPLSLRS
jgi:hypothetical protein